MESNRMRPPVRTQRGSTFVELLVAISIIGVALMVMLTQISISFREASVSEHRAFAYRKAMEMMLTGDSLSGVECARLGWANESVPADRLEQRFGQAGRQGSTERVAIPCDVFDGDIPALTSDRQRHDAARPLEQVDLEPYVCHRAARLDLFGGQVSDLDQQVVQAIGRPYSI